MFTKGCVFGGLKVVLIAGDPPKEVVLIEDCGVICEAKFYEGLLLSRK